MPSLMTLNDGTSDKWQIITTHSVELSSKPKYFVCTTVINQELTSFMESAVMDCRTYLMYRPLPIIKRRNALQLRTVKDIKLPISFLATNQVQIRTRGAQKHQEKHIPFIFLHQSSAWEKISGTFWKYCYMTLHPKNINVSWKKFQTHKTNLLQTIREPEVSHNSQRTLIRY
jgi:hypothetical protein